MPPKDNKQLFLFPSSGSSENHIIGNPNSFPQSKPAKVGKTAVEYIDSTSLLTSPKGFIKAYKFTLNPYTGCSFGCDYCYARFFAPSLEKQQDWGNWVKVKQNAVDLLRRARRARSQKRRLEEGDAIYMSSVTDPYQPIEHKVGLTRSLLEELIEVQPRLTIQTRSPLALRDIDLFQQFQHIRINYTIPTDSEEIRERYEPHCPAIEVRLKSAKDLAEAGIPIGISISPMLPIKDAEKFGKQIAELRASEYVTQFFKPTRSRFSAGTSASAVQKMEEDHWTEQEYDQAKTIISNILGEQRPLLEGSEGYAPV
ncbi:MAG: radical SAM protein [Halothece sp.]